MSRKEMKRTDEKEKTRQFSLGTVARELPGRTRLWALFVGAKLGRSTRRQLSVNAAGGGTGGFNWGGNTRLH